MLLRLLFILLSLPVGATVFQLQTVDQQIKEADGIVIGHFLRQKTVQLENSAIATQMIFKMNKEHGLQSDLFGMDEVIVHYPGGELGPLKVKVEGVPQFVPGESVIVMIKNQNDRYWGLNLGFGSFKVINYGEESVAVNSIFPNDRRVEKLTIPDFEKRVRSIKGSSFKVVHSLEYPSDEGELGSSRAPASVSEGKKRAIASSLDQVENEEGQSRFNTLWLLVFLALIGGIFRFIRQSELK